MGRMWVFIMLSWRSAVRTFSRRAEARRASISDRVRLLQNLIAGEHDLADDVHQIVQQCCICRECSHPPCW